MALSYTSGKPRGKPRNMKASINVVCYTSKKLKNGEHPLMLRICKDNKKKFKSLGISVNPSHWDFRRNKPKPDCPNKEFIMKLILEKEAEYQNKVIELTAYQTEYTAASLLKSNDKIVQKTVREFYLELIQDLVSKEKLGNARVYQESLWSLKNFRNNKLDFFFDEIDVNWLNHYEEWFRSKKCKETTISLQFRTLRSAYNKAVESNYVRKVESPFKRFKISKFDTSTQKRAIPKEDILKIMNLDLSTERDYIQLSRDIFIFSYFCGGINFSDMANLTISQISDGRLVYRRKKTKKQISIPLRPEAISIIEKYSTGKSNSNDYVFPIFNIKAHSTGQQKANRIHKTIAKVNLCLKKIATIANINANLTTYVARHSYATVLKNSGVNVALIGETLGHSDLKTTQIYLDSFENSQIDAAMENLL